MVSERRTLGERWKRQRERRGVTLESISHSTKIPTALFAGLERGDCARWPAGLYSRAYVRSYADAIGISADEAVEDFIGAFGSALQQDGTVAPPARSSKASGALRLSMVDEPTIDPARVARRAGLAAADLIIGVLIAWVAHVGLGTGVWLTLAGALAYHALGRVISDEPLLYWIYLRLRTPSVRALQEEPSGEVVPVGDAASTAA